MLLPKLSLSSPDIPKLILSQVRTLYRANFSYNFSISSLTKSINTLIFSGEKSNVRPAALYSSGKVLVSDVIENYQGIC
jgi:hypothetical protein